MLQRRYGLYILFAFVAIGSQGCRADDLIKAVTDGDRAKVRQLLDAGADPNQISTETDAIAPLLNPGVPVRRKTPVLMLAVQQGQTEIVEALLKAGADPNRPDFRQYYPLYEAVASAPHAEQLTKMLILHGADPNQPNGDTGGVALQRALMDGSLGAPLALLPVTDQKWVTERVSTAARQGGFGPLVHVVVDMYRRGEFPFEEETLGEVSPLIRAVLEQRLDGVEEILRSKPETVEERDRYGFTSLIWASSRFGTPAIVKRLLDARADPNARGEGDWTALYSAVEAGDAEVIGLLCGAGADPNVVIRYGPYRRTLVMEAAARRGADVVQALLAGGADPLVPDLDGTPRLPKCASLNQTTDRDRIRELVESAIAEARK